MAIPLYSHETQNTSTHVHKDRHKCQAKTTLHTHFATASHTKEQHEIFSEFFNMCSIPPARVEVQKRKRDRKEKAGGGDGVNECNGRARKRERETQLTLFQATPPSNSPRSVCALLAG